MTFNEFLAQARTKSDGAGDIMRLASQDARRPEITTLPELEAYLRGRGLSEGMVQEAPLAWARYNQACQPSRRQRPHP